MKRPSRTVMHRGTAMGLEVTMGIIAALDAVAKVTTIGIMANITLDMMETITTEHMTATRIATAGSTKNTDIIKAGTVAAINDITFLIAAAEIIIGIAKVTATVGSTMATAVTSSLIAAVRDTGDEAATVTTPVDDVTDTMATSLLIGADVVITVPDVIMDTTGTNSPTMAAGDMDDKAATVTTAVGDTTDITVTSLPGAAAGAIADTVTDITLDDTSDIADMSSLIVAVKRDITVATTRSADITVTTATSSLTADIGDTKVTMAIITHITLRDDTMDTGATGSLITAVGAVVAGELATPQAGVVRATNTTLVLATKRTTIRKTATRKLTEKKRMANRQQADREDLVLRSPHGCWNTVIRTKMAS